MGTTEMAALPHEYFRTTDIHPQAQLFIDNRIQQGLLLDLSGLPYVIAERVISYVETCDDLPCAVLTVVHYGPWDETRHKYNLPHDLLYRIGAHHGVVVVPLPPDFLSQGSWESVCTLLREIIGTCGYEGVCVSLLQSQDDQALAGTVADRLCADGFSQAIARAIASRNAIRFFGASLLG